MGTEISPKRDGTATASTSSGEDADDSSDIKDSQLHTLFDELDADHSGKIEPAELKVRLASQRAFPCEADTSETLWESARQASYTTLGLLKKYHSQISKHLNLYSSSHIHLSCKPCTEEVIFLCSDVVLV